ncbi:MAG TPA: hypothetical protein VLI72_08365 [Methylibium sp.]|nr:hypothetical protein [Methylibium sp.]
MQIGRVHCQMLALALGAAAIPLAAQAQPKGADPGAIFTCTSAAGRRLTSDRPISECLDREQRVLNKDGSLRMIMPPSLTADERSALEETEKRKQQERIAKQDAIRRDRNLLARFPNEEVHGKAREAALDPARGAIAASEKRLAELEKERKPLQSEAEFYQGKPLPAKLKNQVDTVEVSIQAQRATVTTQHAEVARINANFDAELLRLKKLWGGAEPGSLGPLPQVTAAKALAPAGSAQAATAAPAKKP